MPFRKKDPGKQPNRSSNEDKPPVHPSGADIPTGTNVGQQQGDAKAAADARADIASQESFPASDPPGYSGYAGRERE
ncbi:MAG TPA: hypothetical protein VD971_03895 [Phycisphaerales bacterium]|nr:hypothetical protein [Phycisphaerales bacterium]